MSKRVVQLTFLYALCLSLSSASGQKVLWGKGFGNGGSIYLYSLQLANPRNDLYLAGYYYSAALNLGGVQLPMVIGSQDGFLAKFDSAGNALWAWTPRATNSALLQVAGTDSAGYVYVLGTFYGEVTVGNETFSAPQTGNQNMFLSKLSPQGSVVWGVVVEGNPLTNAMATDPSGNTYFTIGVSAQDSARTFLCKYNSAGTLEWETKIGATGGSGTLFPSDIKLDHLQRPVIAMQILYQASVDGQTVGGTGEKDIDLALIKVSPEGSVLWFAKNNPPLADDWPSMSIDASDNISVAAGNLTRNDSVFDNSFIASYDSIGQRTGLLRHDPGFSCFDLTQDGLGNFFVTGNFVGNMTWGTQTLQAHSQSVFLVKVAPDGTPFWALQSKSTQSTYEFGLRILRSADGAIYAGGLFDTPTVSFGEQTISVNYANSLALYLIKIKDNTPNKLILNLGPDQEICGTPVTFGQSGFARYLWQDGSTKSTFTATKPGTYFLSATDYLGNVQTDSAHVIACITSRIPNVITPNNDDKNEYFVIEDLDTSLPNSLAIYNRWGSEVYKSADYQNDWNGNGLSDGIYFYVFVEAKTNQTLKGWVQIIR